MDHEVPIELTPLAQNGRRPSISLDFRLPNEETNHLPGRYLSISRNLSFSLENGETDVTSESRTNLVGGTGIQQRDNLCYIWGTDIAVEVFRDEFRKFLENFEVSEDNHLNSFHENFDNISSDTSGNQVNSKSGESIIHFEPGISSISAQASFLASARQRKRFHKTTKIYLEKMRQMHLRGDSTLLIDGFLMSQYNQNLYRQCCRHPAECFQMMDAVVEEIYREIFPDASSNMVITVALHNISPHVSLKDLGPSHIDELIGISGMVVRVSKIIPEIRVAHFECWSCKHFERSVVERGRIFEPIRCSHCGKPYSYLIRHNQSLFEDKQLVRIQEAPEHLTDGETPVTVSAAVYGTLVDTIVPGDRVIVTGIFRAMPSKLNANTRIIRSLFRTHIDAVHIEKITRVSSKRRGFHANIVDPRDQEQVDALHQLARHPDIYGILLRSLAKTIWGHVDVKKGILAQMFGGTTKELRHGRFRSELHVLLCGDPGVAKSQLLAQVHEISPRGVYTSGKGSSSVGLTAFVVRDADTGEFALEPGALVLSDQGLCCIDEFDKMNESTRSVLHEVMEQQTLSVAKAGIIAQLNARSSVLSAANPRESQWNPTLNIVENLQIEPTLLSRFDLIFLMLDKNDKEEDRRLAAHVLSLYESSSNDILNDSESEDSQELATLQPEQGSDNDLSVSKDSFPSLLAGQSECHSSVCKGSAINQEYGCGTFHLRKTTRLLHDKNNLLYMSSSTLSRYISYARDHVHPKLSPEAHESLKLAYVNLRKARGSGNTVAATLRQLESMIRLSEAFCKMRYGISVSSTDVDEAEQLMRSALKDAVTDPRTGLINMEMFARSDVYGRDGPHTTEQCIRRLESILQQLWIDQGRLTASMTEVRQVYQEGIPGSSIQSIKPISQYRLTDFLGLAIGGGVVKTFTPNIIYLESKSEN